MSKEEQQNDDSAEGVSGGALRGLSRSMNAGVRRFNVGRLPQQSPRIMAGTKSSARILTPKSMAPKGMGRSMAPKGMGRSMAPKSIGRAAPKPARIVAARKLPTKEIAKLSDRMSTGLDVYDQWTTVVVEDDKKTKRVTKRSRVVDILTDRSNWKRAADFTKNLAKNTVLGMAVFESYARVVSQFAPPNDTATSDGASTTQSAELDDYARASVLVHFGAGFCGGTAHGALETVMSRFSQSIVPLAFSSNLLHHGLAHSVLFGSYELFKRSLSYNGNNTSFGNDNNDVIFLAKTTLAGGLAGQFQHVANHYSDGVLLQKVQVRQIPPPTLRSVMWAFPGAAIGFIAFEYGKLIAV